MTDYAAMTLAELAAAYNARSDKPVKKFKDRPTGIARCLALDGPAPAKVVKAAKVTKVAKPAKVKEDDSRSKLSIEFDARAGTKREVLIEALGAKINEQVAIEQLLTTVYGSNGDANRGALKMIAKGISEMIKKSNLPYQLISEKGSLGLRKV